MYSRSQIDQVREAVDIVEVARGYIPSLKASGRTVKGLCPFHSERTPSFHVNSEKGFFKCFGCGESGDAIAFVSKMEQVGFSDALEKLASDAGIVLKKSNDSGFRANPETSQKERLERLVETAVSFYEKNLWNGAAGKAARAYVEKRGIQEETATRFQMGFSPGVSPGVFEHLVQKGFSVDLCVKSGVVSHSASGRYFDPMFGRLVFPIFDHFGHPVGFGGRVLPNDKKKIFGLGDKEESEEGPKYLNSPETPLFSKGRMFYGLHQAKPTILKKRSALILEGYMDVVGAHQAGATNAIATLGTAFTRDHAKILKRYADEVIFYFDPDEAGRRALTRALEPVLAEKLYPRVVEAPEGQDPDEVALERGSEGLLQLINEAPDFMTVFLKTRVVGKTLSPKEKSDIGAEILPILEAVQDPILKSEWLKALSNALGLEPGALRGALKKPSAAEPARIRPRAAEEKNLPTAEEEFLLLVMNHPEAWPADRRGEMTMATPRIARALELLEKQIADEGKISLPAVQEALPEADHDWFLTLSLLDIEFPDPSLKRDQLVRDIRTIKDRLRLDALSGRIKAGAASPEDKNEFRLLLKKIKGSERVAAASGG